ncbi:MAG TPA: hypothetical protein GX529_08550 [Firmicutes bacterium]|nr:hypothetical protein [Candidatus Fermentithermobacillaceae bacterium]
MGMLHTAGGSETLSAPHQNSQQAESKPQNQIHLGYPKKLQRSSKRRKRKRRPGLNLEPKAYHDEIHDPEIPFIPE